MRASVVHSICPGGREYTKQFAPSRAHLVDLEEKPQKCVCCDENMHLLLCTGGTKPPCEAKATAKRIQRCQNLADLEVGLDTMLQDDNEAEFVEDTEEDEELVSVPSSLCSSSSGVCHYAHPSCLETLQKYEWKTCPRCDNAKKALRSKGGESGAKLYCKDILGGFGATAKLDAMVDFVKKIPASDKCLVLSFFKEGILYHDLGVQYARFDGDVSQDRKLAELERFKRNSKCKVLLATVQSGGIGLNIVEANHICFLDRWYNPFVHEQAEVCSSVMRGIFIAQLTNLTVFCLLVQDRCHRIKQKKEVNVVYIDCGATIDQVIKMINEKKKQNSSILLGDLEVGSQQNLSYQELAGKVTSMIEATSSFRNAWLMGDSGRRNEPIPAVPELLLDRAVADESLSADELE